MESTVVFMGLGLFLFNFAVIIVRYQIVWSGEKVVRQLHPSLHVSTTWVELSGRTAVTVSFVMALKYPDGDYCTGQNPFTKWQYNNSNIINLLIEWPLSKLLQGSDP